MESAYKGTAEIAGDEAVNKLGKYSGKHKTQGGQRKGA